MNPQGTSFIPQRPTHGTVKKHGVRKIYILTYVSYILFFGSALSAAGTYFYSAIVDSRLQTQKDALVEQRTRFSQGDMNSVQELDRKIEMAKKRMDMHLSVPAIFKALEENSVQTVQLTGFSYERENDAAPQLEITGTAKIFNTVMFQRDIMNLNPILAGGIFTEVTLGSAKSANGNTNTSSETDSNATIAFQVTNKIAPTLIGYDPQLGQFTNTASQQEEILFNTNDVPVDDVQNVDVTDVPN